ncbi:hypothetical protein DPMN_119102 [Dreissena polymorpha]|uniref:Uncharacterized protein n=1 Tax=Dreissena polymorpha TaxID=45954 RepID=A0A9D4JP41_DREPO|nr:hypothetical protein DPMN_119102 [Dreissena polymorpha]
MSGDRIYDYTVGRCTPYPLYHVKLHRLKNIDIVWHQFSAFAESAVKASLFEMDVVDNVNHSAMVPTSAVKARRSPRTVKEFLGTRGPFKMSTHVQLMREAFEK